jgi:hypothetical protein
MICSGIRDKVTIRTAMAAVTASKVIDDDFSAALWRVRIAFQPSMCPVVPLVHEEIEHGHRIVDWNLVEVLTHNF